MNTRPLPNSLRQMADLPEAEQAKVAIRHTLKRIRDHAHIGYYMGEGSQAFELLTEAYATLAGDNVSHIRAIYRPVNATKPQHLM